jgi:hypothetical protein
MEYRQPELDSGSLILNKSVTLGGRILKQVQNDGTTGLDIEASSK